MAARRREASEAQMARVIEETIYVAVGKKVKQCKENLLWVLQKSGGNYRICILHVHQPAQRIQGGLGAKVPASSLKEEVVSEYRETERQKMEGILDKYLHICRRMKVSAQTLYMETNSVEKGIVELISQHGIRGLVMGAAADNRYSEKMTEIKSKKAKYVLENAPPSCHIHLVCKGNYIFTRQVQYQHMEAGANSPNVPFHNFAEDPSSSKGRSSDGWDGSSRGASSSGSSRSSQGELLKKLSKLVSWKEQNGKSLEFDDLFSVSLGSSSRSSLSRCCSIIQEDWIQRQEVEELERVRNERDQLVKELRISREREISLQIQIGELQMERDKALKEAEWLKRKPAGRVHRSYSWL